MRVFGWPFLFALSLAGCAGGPSALGITGPAGSQNSFGAVKLPSGLSTDNSLVLPPGQPVDAGEKYAPSVVPTFGTTSPYYGE